MSLSKEIGHLVWAPSQFERIEEHRFIEKEIDGIGIDHLNKLALLASSASVNAYKPVSGYAVGAAILTHAGNVYSAANAEVVTHTETDHAERAAISAAINNGEIKMFEFGRKFIRVVAVSHKGE